MIEKKNVWWDWLSILQVCLEEEDHVGIHIHLQDIIIVKREEKIQGWSRKSAKSGFKIDQHTKLEDVPYGIGDFMVW